MPETTLTPKQVRIAEDEAKWLRPPLPRARSRRTICCASRCIVYARTWGRPAGSSPKLSSLPRRRPSTSSPRLARRPAKRSRPPRSRQACQGTGRRRRRKLPRVLAPAKRLISSRAASIAQPMCANRRKCVQRATVHVSKSGLGDNSRTSSATCSRSTVVMICRSASAATSLSHAGGLRGGSKVALRITSLAFDASHQSALPLRRATQNHLHPLPRRRPHLLAGHLDVAARSHDGHDVRTVADCAAACHIRGR
jgi:hypothetical protein